MINTDGPSSAEGKLDRRQLLKGGLGLALGASALGLVGCGSSSSGSSASGASGSSAAAPTVKAVADGDINWLTWAEYIPTSVVKSFEKEYKVKVTQSFMTDDEQYIQKLAAGQPFDLITTNSAYMPQSIGGGLLQTFDPGELKNWDQLIEYFKNPFYDNGAHRYTIPYGYGPTGIMYRSDKVTKISHTWNDLWNNPEAAGHTYVLDQVEEALGMSLLRDGKSLNSANPGDVTTAASNIISLKKSLGGITTNSAPLIASGQAWLMHAWSTAVYQGIKQSKTPENIKFYLPTDGAPVGADTLSIGKHAKSPGTALLFMDWILKPENNHALGAWAAQKTGAKGGNAAFDETVKKYPMFTFDDEKVLSDRGNWKIAPTGQRLSLYNQQWARVNA
jgi:spermidine/putrescine transport system substrate-binding protein